MQIQLEKLPEVPPPKAKRCTVELLPHRTNESKLASFNGGDQKGIRRWPDLVSLAGILCSPCHGQLVIKSKG